jgi:hypothetical protein
VWKNNLQSIEQQAKQQMQQQKQLEEVEALISRQHNGA